MDPAVLRELQTQIGELNDALNSLGGSMSNLTRSAKDSTQAQNSDTNEKNKNTDTANKGSAAVNAVKNSQEAASKKIQEASANFNRALMQTKQAVTQFSQAVFSSEEGMAKYGRASSSLGEAAFSVGRNFGILGTVLGGALAIFGAAVGEVFKLDDNIIKFRDGFTKASGVLPTTAGELGNLAKQARFSLDDMQKLAKTTSSLGTSLTSLGGYAGDGAVKFMKMAAVSDDVRRQYGRMGISQEELLDSQAKYIQMQGVSGQSLNNQRKSTKQLQQESLAYADNLTRMSSLTGKSKDELQAARETAMLEYEEQLKIAEENQRIQDLRAQGRNQEADAVAKEQKNRQQLIQTYTDLYGAEQGQLAGRVMRQGGYDEKTAIFKQRGEDMVGFTEKLKTSNNAMGDIAKQAEKTDAAIVDAAGKFNQSLQVAGEQTGNKLVGSKEQLLAINKRSGSKITDTLAKIDKDMEKKKQAGTDPLADNIESMRSFEREAKAKLQSLLEKIDPLRNGFDMLKKAAYAVAAVAGIVLLGKGAASLMGRGGGAAGAAGEAAAGAAGAGGMAGSAAAGATTIRKADLLDKRGRVLQGAALDARMKKLSGGAATKLDKDDGTFGGIIDALKRAGRSSFQVVKGAGALSIATVELAVGLRAATGIMGIGIIKFVKGLNELDKLDGKNLVQVGLGMAGLGAGVLAMGAGTVASAVGNIAKFFTGGKDPLVQAAEMLTKLSKMNLDRKKIENNGAALMAFAKAMGAIAALGAGSAIAGAIKGVFNGLAGLMGAKMPVEELQDFSKKNINLPKVMINSMALAAFGNAMSSFKGSSAKQAGAAIADTTTSFFKATPPYMQMLMFSMLYIDSKNVKKNASAFKAFAEAMAAYEGYGSSSGAAGAAISEAVTGFFKVDPPFDQLVRFSELPINVKGAMRNSIAFVNFATAMASYKGLGSPTSTIATALADATSKFFKVKPPLEQAVYFSQLNINPKKTRTNAKSFVLFSDAMASYKGGEGLLSAVNTIAAAGLNKLFGQDSAVDAFYKFSKKDFGPKAAQNARAFLDFSKAMGILSGGGSSSFLSNMGSAIAGAAGAAAGVVSGAAGAVWGGLQNLGFKLSGGAADFIAKFEGFSGRAYMFPGEKLYTIGYGHVIQPQEVKAGKLPNGVPVVGPLGRDTVMTKEQAISLLQNDLPKYERPAAAALGSGWSNLNSSQRAAFTSYAYNAGAGGVSKFIKNNNLSGMAANKDWQGMSAAFRDKGVRTGSGRVLPGLVKRRAAEGQLILQAKKGGLFTGPSTGYPMELHGTEMVIPQMSPNSLLMKLAKTNAAIADLGSMIENMQAQVSTDVLPSSPMSEKATSTTFLNPQMIATLANKFDSVINILGESDDVQDKLLKHSMV